MTLYQTDSIYTDINKINFLLFKLSLNIHVIVFIFKIVTRLKENVLTAYFHYFFKFETCA